MLPDRQWTAKPFHCFTLYCVTFKASLLCTVTMSITVTLSISVSVKFYVMWKVMDHLTERMRSVPNLPVKWSIFIDTMLKFDIDGHADGDGTCKQVFTVYCCTFCLNILLVLQHNSGPEASISRIRLHSAIPSGVHLLHGQLHDHRVIPGECLTHYTTWSQSHSRWVFHPLHYMITESFQVSVPPTTLHDHRVIPGECPTHYTTCPQSHIRWVSLPLNHMITESFQVSTLPLHYMITESLQVSAHPLHYMITVITGECLTHYTTWSQSHSRWVSHPLHYMITESFQVSVPPTTQHGYRVISGECPFH